jgi:hypothetical protein
MVRLVLPTPGGPRNSTFSPLANPPPGGQIADLLGIDGGFGGEILGGDLAFAQEVQPLANGHVALGGMVEEVVDLIADAGEL